MSTSGDASARAPSRLFLSLASIAWVLIAFGALVRSKQAGLSCPDWPLCHGDVVPDLQLKGVVYEFGHRVLAGGVTLTFVAGLLLVWRRGLWPKVRRWALFASAILVVQIVFGGLTVLIVHHGAGAPRPAWWTVATHLVLGNGFAATALVLGLKLRRLARGIEPEATALSPLARTLAVAWTVSLLTQFVLGGSIAGNVAGLVCTTFPACNGDLWFPSFGGLVGLQIFHRLNAALLVVLGASLLVATRRAGRLARTTRVLGALVAGQFVLGAVNIFAALHTPVTTAHSAMAALLFSTTAVLWFDLAASPSWSREA